jgi:hypothetical protein
VHFDIATPNVFLVGIIRIATTNFPWQQQTSNFSDKALLRTLGGMVDSSSAT